MALALAAISTPAAAYCEGASSKFEAEECLETVLGERDAALNAAYRVAMGNAKAFDADIGLPVSAATALRNAQRAWIRFRDAACEAETLPFAIGGGGLLRAEMECKLGYTDARTIDLERLAGDLER